MKLRRGVEPRVNRTQRAQELVRGVEGAPKPLWTEVDIETLYAGLENARGTNTSLYILAILHIVRPGVVSSESKKSFLHAYIDSQVKPGLSQWREEVKRGDQRNMTHVAINLLDDIFPAVIVDPSARKKLPQDTTFGETLRKLSDEDPWRNVIRGQAVLFAEDFSTIVKPEHWERLVGYLDNHRAKHEPYDVLNDLVTLRVFSPKRFAQEVTVSASDKELIQQYLEKEKKESTAEYITPEYARALFFTILATAAELKVTKQNGLEAKLEPPQFQPPTALPDRLAI